MIKRLKKRFVATAFLSVVAVMAVLMTIMNVWNYQSADSRCQQVMDILVENGGEFPSYNAGDTPPGMSSGSGNGATDMPGGQGKGPVSQELPFETRYFTVLVNASGSASQVNVDNIAAISESQASQIAESLYQEKKASGYYQDYKYQAADQDGGTLYVFVDCSRERESVRSFLRISLTVCAIGLAGVLVILILGADKAVQPMAESYQKQKAFITNASHELKTPVSAIKSCAEVLEMEQGENKWVRNILTEADRMTDLTADLVDLSRMDEDSSDIEKKDFDFSKAVQEALEPFEASARESGLTMRTVMEPGIRYNGNEKLLKQLASILADNAVKYTPAGGNIIFRLSKKGKRIVLTEENDALNMAPGSQDVLFERFYRKDDVRGSGKEGYGIGLSMARSIVEAHGGTIRAYSPTGRTLKFTAEF